MRQNRTRTRNGHTGKKREQQKRGGALEGDRDLKGKTPTEPNEKCTQQISRHTKKTRKHTDPTRKRKSKGSNKIARRTHQRRLFEF